MNFDDLDESFETGYPGAEQDQWCVRRVGAGHTLCGRQVNVLNANGSFPRLAPPRDVAKADPECLRLLAKAFGVCPVCGETVLLVGTRIGEHGGCPGVNLRPKRGRR